MGPHDSLIPSKASEIADLVLGARRAVGVALLYLAALLLLGAPAYKAAVIAVLAFIAVQAALGSRVVQTVAAALVVYLLGWWLGALPGPATVQAIAGRIAGA